MVPRRIVPFGSLRLRSGHAAQGKGNGFAQGTISTSRWGHLQHFSLGERSRTHNLSNPLQMKPINISDGHDGQVMELAQTHIHSPIAPQPGL